jgi:hypothetical protein
MTINEAIELLRRFPPESRFLTYGQVCVEIKEERLTYFDFDCDDKDIPDWSKE